MKRGGPKFRYALQRSHRIDKKAATAKIVQFAIGDGTCNTERISCEFYAPGPMIAILLSMKEAPFESSKQGLRQSLSNFAKSSVSGLLRLTTIVNHVELCWMKLG